MVVLHKGSKGCHVLGRQTGKGDILPEEIENLSFKMENMISEDGSERFQEESCQFHVSPNMKTMFVGGNRRLATSCVTQVYWKVEWAYYGIQGSSKSRLGPGGYQNCN